MASTYTTNLGIEKIADGEQSETWGDTTNTNFDLIDQGINGIISITLASAGNSGSPNDLPITDGTVSDGRNKFIEFVDGGDLGATAYVQLTPNDAEKLVFIRNSLSGGQSLIVFQGTYNASNDFEIANGKDVVLKFNGAGASATVTQVFNDLSISALDVSGTLTTSNLTIEGAIDEAVYNLTGTALDASNGTIQTKTLTGNTTLTDSLNEGEAITLMIDDGSAYTLTFPTITWVNNGGSAPTLATTGYTVFALWKVSTTLYGALVGDGS